MKNKIKWFLVKVMSNRYVNAVMSHPQTADTLAFVTVRLFN